MPSPRALLRKDTLVNGGILLGTIISLILIVHTVGDDNLRAYVENAGAWGWAALILAKASTMVFAPLSGALLYPLAGTLFGFWPGLLLVLIGDALGGTISFYISRAWGRRLVERMLGDDAGLLNRALSLMGSVRGFVVARALLAPMPELATYAAGLTRIRFLPFLAIHLTIGLIPQALLTGLGSLIIERTHPFVMLLMLGGISIFGAISILGFMYLVNGKSAFTDQETSPQPENSETNS